VGAKKILLADLDPLTGTIAFLLKLRSQYSFLDVLSRESSLDADLWKQMVVQTQGVDVLLSPEHLVEGAGDLQDPSAIVDFAQATYEISVFDCGSAYGAWNLGLASLCDELILTTTNELPSLQAAQKVLAYFDQYHIDHTKIRVVVNRYDRDIGLNSDIIGSALQSEVFQVIPSDYDTVQRSQMDGKPIPPNSTFGKNLGNLATRLCSKTNFESNDKNAGSLGGLMSIFSRASS
jgi:Flp pilus assembly CpaE family ATPase